MKKAYMTDNMTGMAERFSGTAFVCFFAGFFRHAQKQKAVRT